MSTDISITDTSMGNGAMGGDATINVGGGDSTMHAAIPDATLHSPIAQASSLAMDVTARTNGMAGQPEHVSGDYFVLKGVRYRNVKCLSDNSGEAQVFLVEHEGEEHVLKIYYPNFKVNKKIFQTVLAFDFEMLVKVYDFGKTYVEGKHRYYELMEYLRGGSMSDYKLNEDENKFRRIALQAAAALAYCHGCNILHKDVKPSNFFFRDREQTELVLGDFGISCIIDQDGKVHKTTQARTPIYAAPEMYSDVIDGMVEVSAAADFYSLGISLLALWLGGNPMSTNERVMMRQKNEGRLPHMNELPERVRMIIQGLTVVNPINRWGYEEVEKWFQGESPRVDLSSPFLRYKSFLVDPDKNLVADNIHELIPLLLDNEKLAMGYLYSGRITTWLEACGNQKMSTIVKDIVVNRYPVDQHAGLMAAVYAMEPTYPYKDVKGNLCDDVHSLAISMLSYQEEYGLLLKNPNESLFLYLESHTKCDINRLRSYFADSEHYNPRVAIMRTVYEIDPEVPFLTRYPSSGVKDIVKAFGMEDLTEDDWHSLIDGRLLSWMYCHEDRMACESLRILIQGQPYSKSLAYKVLYNLDREAGYDLKNASSPEEVGKLLNERLQNAEHLDEREYQEEFRDFTDLNGRFFYYAQMHGWIDKLGEYTRCFDLTSKENRERLGIYDAKTALYQFCRILGVTPVYLLSDGTKLSDGRNINPRNYSLAREEMRSGSFLQWMSVFYHEDPEADFSEEYAYEHVLEEWVMALGMIDKSQTYYKRFVDAREEIANRVKNVRNSWAQAKGMERNWRMAFFGLCALWILLVLIVGVDRSSRPFLFDHSFLCIGLPLGGMTGIIVGTRAYFRGFDMMFSCLWGLLGLLSSFIPITILKYVGQSHPDLFNLTIVVITVVYMLVCHLTDFRGDQKADNKLISEVLEDDVKSTLLEPLYYTFKTKSYRFKGSKFGLLNDVTDQVRSISGESVLHYALWTIMALLFVLEFIIFSPKIFDAGSPDTDHMKIAPSEIIKHLEKDAK